MRSRKLCHPVLQTTGFPACRSRRERSLVELLEHSNVSAGSIGRSDARKRAKKVKGRNDRRRAPGIFSETLLRGFSFDAAFPFWKQTETTAKWSINRCQNRKIPTVPGRENGGKLLR